MEGQHTIDKMPLVENVATGGPGQNIMHGEEDRRGSRDQRGRGKERWKSHGPGGGHSGRKKQEIGRSQWSRIKVDKRKRNDEEQTTKRQKVKHDGEGAVSNRFTQEEIAAEQRKPKRKVAVLIGYAGSGYKGMQINNSEKTIEGDLFSAFVAAGAISKANADDPKKSSLARCARTDKGVHAAGNVISLKLIMEDPDMVTRINDALPPQIRVWGIESTNRSFSCYQTCDSRWYEYLIPTYSFLPPHPRSYLGKCIAKSAEEEGVLENYQARQVDVATFWEDAETKYVNPILAKLDPESREAVMEAIHTTESDQKLVADEKGIGGEEEEVDDNSKAYDQDVTTPAEAQDMSNSLVQDDLATKLPEEAPVIPGIGDDAAFLEKSPNSESLMSKPILNPVEAAVKEVKAAYIQARKAYRISALRRQRVEDALSMYIGTRNFHNYTVQKSFKDPSAKRVIRSFKVSHDPIIINDTEWLSLKVHGQSFMMHQIRKMVAMVALVIRCGTPLSRISESYGADNISIPKAPGLGLLLERPVFETYNERAVKDYQRNKIDFSNYEKEIMEFKQKQIYERIFMEEDRDHQFHNFFHHIDHYRTKAFLWVTSTGISAVKDGLTEGEVGGDLSSEDTILLDSNSEDGTDDNPGNEEG